MNNSGAIAGITGIYNSTSGDPVSLLTPVLIIGGILLLSIIIAVILTFLDEPSQK